MDELRAELIPSDNAAASKPTNWRFISALLLAIAMTALVAWALVCLLLVPLYKRDLAQFHMALPAPTGLLVSVRPVVYLAFFIWLAAGLVGKEFFLKRKTAAVVSGIAAVLFAGLAVLSWLAMEAPFTVIGRQVQ